MYGIPPCLSSADACPLLSLALWQRTWSIIIQFPGPWSRAGQSSQSVSPSHVRSPRIQDTGQVLTCRLLPSAPWHKGGREKGRGGAVALTAANFYHISLFPFFSPSLGQNVVRRQRWGWNWSLIAITTPDATSLLRLSLVVLVCATCVRARSKPSARDERVLRIVRRTSPRKCGGRLWRFEQNDRRADRAALFVSPQWYQIAASGHRMLLDSIGLGIRGTCYRTRKEHGAEREGTLKEESSTYSQNRAASCDHPPWL